MPRFFLLCLGLLAASASITAQSVSFRLGPQNIIQIPAELEGDTITLMLHTGHSGVAVTEEAASRIFLDEAGQSFES